MQRSQMSRHYLQITFTHLFKQIQIYRVLPETKLLEKAKGECRIIKERKQ